MFMKKISVLILSILSVSLYAQDISSILFSGYSVDYFGQLSDNGKEREGMGFLRMKKGNLYAGNLRKSKFHGYGMMIAGEKGIIDHCDGAYVYVGEWENGIKQGKGTIYDRSGLAIYTGLFVDDAPTEKYPSENIGVTKHFTYLDLDEDDEKQLYIGEVDNGKPDGYGMTLDEEGFMVLSSFRDGNENGIAIMLYPPNYWTTFKAKDGKWFLISSSREQAKRKANNRDVAARERAELINSLNKVLESGAQLADRIGQIKSGGSNVGSQVPIESTDNIINDGLGNSDTKLQNHSSDYQTQYNNWARRAEKNYNSLTNLGYSATNKKGKKSGGTMQSMSGGNYNQMMRSLREAQHEMERIRQKAARDGIKIQESPWETATVNY